MTDEQHTEIGVTRITWNLNKPIHGIAGEQFVDERPTEE